MIWGYPYFWKPPVEDWWIFYKSQRFFGCFSSRQALSDLSLHMTVVEPRKMAFHVETLRSWSDWWSQKIKGGDLCWKRIYVGHVLEASYSKKVLVVLIVLTKHEMFGHPPFVDTNLGISNRSRSPDIDGVITMRRSGAGRGPNCEGVKPAFQLVFP